MAKVFLNLKQTGLTIGNLTFSWIKKISNGTSVSTSGSTLTERGNGLYILENPNVTEDSDFRVYVTSSPSIFNFGIFSATLNNTSLIGTLSQESTLNNNTQKLFTLIESQRGSHTGTGNIYYWDPINGNDVNDSLTPTTARKTFASINTNLVSDSNHDIIYIYTGPAGGPTTITETITMNKRYTFLRGPGRDCLFKPTSTVNDTITITAEGIEISGVRVETANSGSKDAIVVTGDFTRIHNTWIDQSRGHGIRIVGASNCQIHDFIIESSAEGGSGRALLLDGTSSTTRRNYIWNGKIVHNYNTGIEIRGVNAVDNIIFGDSEGMIIKDNIGWGITEINSANDNVILGPQVYISGNTLGQISLTGSDSRAENVEQWAKNSDIDLIKNKNGSGTFNRITDSLEAISELMAHETTLQTLSGDVEDANYFLNNNVTFTDKLIVQPVQGNFDYARIKKQQVEIKKGDSPDIPYNLNSNITGYNVFFGAKENYSDETYAIAIRDITSTAILSAGTGTIPLSAGETNIEDGDYIGEIQLRKDGIILTPSEFKIKILPSIF